eukprot:SAG11_NODE_3062_length_2717_cov_3.550420_1_plen_42_part_00
MQRDTSFARSAAAGMMAAGAMTCAGQYTDHSSTSLAQNREL